MTDAGFAGMPPLILDTLAIPVARLRTICRRLSPAKKKFRKQIPVLECVHISAGPTGTTFRMTDLDKEIIIRQDDLTCAVAFHACARFDLLQKIGTNFDGTLSITYTPDLPKPPTLARLTLTTEDGCVATVNLVNPPEDYPFLLKDNMLDPADWLFMTATPAELRRLLDLARPCICTEETRYYLNGIFLCGHPDRGTLRGVATDGHRMAVIDSTIALNGTVKAILPEDLVRTLCSTIVPKANAPVTLALHKDGRYVQITCGDLHIDAKLIDGTFPDYTKILPTAPRPVSMTLSAGMLRPLRLCASQFATGVVLGAGRASLKDPNTQNTVSVPVQITTAPLEEGQVASPGPWGLNLRYLLSQAQLTPTFRLDCARPDEPVLARGEDTDALWVLMPMRV